jgi:hypothetical protein
MRRPITGPGGETSYGSATPEIKWATPKDRPHIISGSWDYQLMPPQVPTRVASGGLANRRIVDVEPEPKVFLVKTLTMSELVADRRSSEDLERQIALVDRTGKLGQPPGELAAHRVAGMAPRQLNRGVADGRAAEQRIANDRDPLAWVLSVRQRARDSRQRVAGVEARVHPARRHLAPRRSPHSRFDNGTVPPDTFQPTIRFWLADLKLGARRDQPSRGFGARCVGARH